MQQVRKPGLLGNAELKEELALLAAIEPGDFPFISCYLNAGAGKTACHQFLEQKAAVIRPTLSGSARFAFENALAMLRRHLEEHWNAGAQGLAMFARGLAGGRHLSVMRFAVPFENSMAVYRVPEVLPLVELLQREPEFTLVLAHRGQVQVLDIDLGKAAPRAWVNDFGTIGAAFSTPNNAAASAAKNRVAALGGAQRFIQRSAAASSTPLLLAGDEEALKKIVDWLPQRAVSRLLGTLAVPRSFGQREAVDLVRSQFAAMHAEDAKQLASRLVTAVRTQGQAVAGNLATLEALRQGNVDTLVISDAGKPNMGARWDEKIELSRQAWQQGTRVVLAESEELRYLGGVGCLLRQCHEKRAMPVSARFGHLELVA